MSDQDPDDVRLAETLDAHELAVKRSVESLGDLQAELGAVADDIADDEIRDRLANLGRYLETHESRLEAVVETLDDHKSVVRSLDTGDRSALAETMERARRRARQESKPPTPGDHEEP